MMKLRDTKTILSVEDTEVEYYELPEEIEEIHEILSEENAKNLNFKKFPLRPSGANKTDLELYMELENWDAANKGLPIPYQPAQLDGRVVSLLNLGHTIEPQVIAHVEKIYDVVHTNRTVNYGSIVTKEGTRIELCGELDMAIQHKEYPTKRIIADSKTSGRFAFNLTPKAEHFAQINLYLHSEEMKAEGFKEGRIYYYNKDNSEMKSYGFKYSKELAEAVLGKFQRIYGAWEAGERPAQEAFWGGDDWRADYSSFRHQLHARFKKDIALRDQQIDSVSYHDFKDMLKQLGQKKAINVLAKKYDDKVLVEKETGKKAYLSLTSKGLVAIIEAEDGFSSLNKVSGGKR